MRIRAKWRLMVRMIRVTTMRWVTSRQTLPRAAILWVLRHTTDSIPTWIQVREWMIINIPRMPLREAIMISVSILLAISTVRDPIPAPKRTSRKWMKTTTLIVRVLTKNGSSPTIQVCNLMMRRRVWRKRAHWSVMRRISQADKLTRWCSNRARALYLTSCTGKRWAKVSEMQLRLKRWIIRWWITVYSTISTSRKSSTKAPDR